jgi:hypothetical protein
MASKEHWTGEPAEHDFPAALEYLSLVLDEAIAKTVVGELRRVPTTARKAKDVLRASRLPLLPVDDAEVAKALKRVKKGERLSPVLLVRGSIAADQPLTVADGYHRICASYHLDDDAPVRCRIAALPAGRAARGASR